MAYTQILKDLLATILDASTAVAATDTFALPTGSLAITWQVSADGVPAALTVALQISLDGINWVEVASMSEAVMTNNTYMATVTAPYAAKFIRAVVGSNTSPRAITIQLLVTRFPG